MIYQITGILAAIESNTLIIMQGGLGIGVVVARPMSYQVGSEVTVQTVLHWNQETGPQIFGFETILEKQLFSLVTSCSGVGPKLALALLQVTPIVTSIDAIRRGDVSYLSSIKGIGPKKAELIVMSLRGKLEGLSTFMSDFDQRSQHTPLNDVSDALQALRYSSAEITMTLSALQQDSSVASAPFDQLMRRALLILARQNKTL